LGIGGSMRCTGCRSVVRVVQHRAVPYALLSKLCTLEAYCWHIRQLCKKSQTVWSYSLHILVSATLNRVI